jgi:hypothetical protein
MLHDLINVSLKLWGSSLFKFLRLPIISSTFRLKILLISLFSNIFSLYSPLCLHLPIISFFFDPNIFLSTSLPSVNRLSTEYRETSTSHKLTGIHGLLQGHHFLMYIHIHKIYVIAPAWARKNVSSNQQPNNAEKKRLIVTANVPSLPFLVTLILEALLSSETSGLNKSHTV